MKKLIMALGIVFVIGAEPTYAFNQDWGGMEDDWSMPTTTSYTGPTTTECQARPSKNQRCRQCENALDDNGYPKRYQVCGWLSTNASCSCEGAGTSKCVSQGSCKYVFNG